MEIQVRNRGMCVYVVVVVVVEVVVKLKWGGRR